MFDIVGLLDRLEMCDNLHEVRRKIHHKERYESDTEHTYGAMQLFLAISHLLPEHIKKARVYELLLAHDLAEGLAGDTVIFDVSSESLARERKLAYQLLSPYSDLLESWLEFADNTTEEAIIANKIDKIQAVTKIITDGGRDWYSWGITLEKATSYVKWVVDGDDILSELMRTLLKRADNLGMFADSK